MKIFFVRKTNLNKMRFEERSFLTKKKEYPWVFLLKKKGLDPKNPMVFKEKLIPFRNFAHLKDFFFLFLFFKGEF